MNIDVNGTTLFYERTGAGAPLLLLHGNGEDHHIFDALAGKLAAHYTVYAIDSRNHGQSGKTNEYAYATMAEDISAFIRALQLKGVNLLGFSDGAIVSLLVAMAHGGLVQKMALLGVNLTPRDFTDESYQFVKETYEETGDPLFKLMLEQPNIGLDEVKGIATPTLLVAAENDIFKPESFERLRAALPDASLKVIPGHDHDSYISGQDMLYPDLLRFFG